MHDYLVMLVSVSIICGIVKLLSPGKSDISIALKLVFVSVVLFPVISFFGFTYDADELFVINESAEHSIDNEDADLIWRRWLAEATADELSEDISSGIYEYYGIEASVDVPWHWEGDNVVFEVIKVKADCDEAKCTDIRNWIKIHYSLESVCIAEK